MALIGINLIRLGRVAVSRHRTVVAASNHLKLAMNVTQVRNRVNPANPGLMYPKEGIEETDEEFDKRFEDYFNREDIDSWEIRKGITELHGYDLVPEPKIMIAVLKACRRLNDHSLAVRYLEAVWRKASYKKEITDYLMQEIRPTLNELGISTPEELGYDKPELALGDSERCPLYEK